MVLRRYIYAAAVTWLVSGLSAAWGASPQASVASTAVVVGAADPTSVARPVPKPKSVSPSSAKPKPKPPSSSLFWVTSAEGIIEYRMSNGLQVLLINDASKPTTTVNMTYRVGSRSENYGETGMAHLLEHLIFKGSPKHPNVWAEFSKRGLRANGSTWYDRTNYFASFAADDENLRWYLEWQADAMTNSFIARKDLDSEMTVVRNEMEMGENEPERILYEQTVAAMYRWHNYGKSTIGARTDVEGVEIARLQAFYRMYYQPDNATLIVSGKFDQDKVLGWIKGAFGSLPKPQRSLPRQYTLDPVQDGERSVTLRRVGGVPLLMAAYHVPSAADADYAAVEALDLILGDTPSGRLHKRLTQRGLAAGVFASTQGLFDPGFAVFGAQLAPEQNLDSARDALLSTLESLATEPITDDELQRAKAKWLKNWDTAFTDPQTVGVALSEAVAQGDWRLYFLLRDRVRALKLSDVQRVASAIFVKSNRTLGSYVPTAQPQRAPAPARVDLAAQFTDFKSDILPAQAEAFDASPANIDKRTQRFELVNGMEVALLSKATRGAAVRATLTLRFGDEKSLSGWGEVPAMLAEMLNKGSQKLSRDQIQDRLDQLQSELRFSSSPGVLNVGIVSRRQHLPALIALMGELLRQPAFPKDALEEVRSQALAGLEQQRKDPETLANNALDRHGNPYPVGDVRYARTFDEMAADFKAVTRERVREFHQRFYGANHAEFAAVGDMDESQVRQALSAAFGDWSGASAYARIPEPLFDVPPARLEFVTADKQNAALAARLPLPLSDRDPDYPAMMLANYLIGGGGDSRLWNRLREKEGLSYSVYSAVDWNPFEAHSTWLLAANFAPQNRDKVELAVHEEMKRVLSTGFTVVELEAGRRSLLNFRQLARAQDGRLAAALALNLQLGRSYTEAARVDQALRSLTLDQVNAALRRYISEDRVVWALAGDFSTGQPAGK